jgi:hypothetical protein
MALFEFDGLDEVAETLDMVSKAYPKEVKKFMQSEGNKLKKENQAKSNV